MTEVEWTGVQVALIRARFAFGAPSGDDCAGNFFGLGRASRCAFESGGGCCCFLGAEEKPAKPDLEDAETASSRAGEAVCVGPWLAADEEEVGDSFGGTWRGGFVAVEAGEARLFV